MPYLVDTGVWLRLFDRSDPAHTAIRAAITLLRSTGHVLAACPQNIGEFWNVSTLNAADFARYAGIIAVTPQALLSAPKT